MQAFTWRFPTKLVFGSGSLAGAGAEARALGRRPLLITGRHAMRASGVLEKLLGLLRASGVEPVLFERAEPNPRRETLDEAVRVALHEGCDSVIGLGGGSPMDSAKAVAAAAAESRRRAEAGAEEPVSVWEFTNAMGSKKLPVKDPLPLLLISSTAATGSEANCAAVITWWQTREKAVLWDLAAFPAASIVDPEIMLSLPLEATRDGIVDLMLHALEQSFNGDDKAWVQDSIAAGLCRGAMKCLERLERDPRDLTARENASWASVAALMGGGGPSWGRTGGFTVHHLEHPLSGHTDVAHGRGLGLLWPHYLEAILSKREAKIADLGAELFSVAPGPSAAPKAIEALRAWLKAHGFTQRLRDYGCDEAMIPKLAADAVRISGGGRDFLAAPLPFTKERCEAVYRAAL